MNDAEYKQLACCNGKTKHESRSKAAIEMKRTNKQKRRCPNMQIKPYRCAYCGFWHVGNGRV